MDDNGFEDALDKLIGAFAAWSLKDNGEDVDVTISPCYPKSWALPKTLFGFRQSFYNDPRRRAGDIEVVVGAKHQRRWFVPERTLCEKSRFFSAALRGYFKGAYEKKVHFPEEDPDIFAFWMDWLVSGLISWENCLLRSPSRLVEFAEADILCLQQLYVLGERLDSREFQLDIINLIYDYFLRRQPALNFSIETVYRETLLGNVLRLLITAYIVTFLVENVALPCKIWNPPVTCILDFKGLSKLVCTREMLYELATEVFEQYGCTGEGFVKLFDCERDKDSGRRWADFWEDWT